MRPLYFIRMRRILDFSLFFKVDMMKGCGLHPFFRVRLVLS